MSNKLLEASIFELTGLWTALLSLFANRLRVAANVSPRGSLKQLANAHNVKVQQMLLGFELLHRLNLLARLRIEKNNFLELSLSPCY